jgi:hypothetical protein
MCRAELQPASSSRRLLFQQSENTGAPTLTVCGGWQQEGRGCQPGLCALRCLAHPGWAAAAHCGGAADSWGAAGWSAQQAGCFPAGRLCSTNRSSTCSLMPVSVQMQMLPSTDAENSSFALVAKASAVTAPLWLSSRRSSCPLLRSQTCGAGWAELAGAVGGAWLRRWLTRFAGRLRRCGAAAGSAVPHLDGALALRGAEDLTPQLVVGHAHRGHLPPGVQHAHHLHRHLARSGMSGYRVD